MQDSSLDAAGLAVAAISLAWISLSQARYFAAKKERQTYLNCISYQAWKRAHFLSQTTYVVTVLLLSPLELAAGVWWGAEFYQNSVLRCSRMADHYIVLPALAVATTSGAAICFELYVSHQKPVPWHFDRAMKTIAGFGLYWAACDKVTQYVPVSCWIRSLINLGSCAITLNLWLLGRRGVAARSKRLG